MDRLSIGFGDREAIKLRAVCLAATLRCTLRCKLCIARTPLLDNPYHPTTGYLERQANALFSVVSFVEDFNISGGEPFLRTDLAELLAFLRVHHKDQMGRCRIFTNGTLLPPLNGKVDFYEEARRWGDSFSVVVDRYTVSTKCDELAACLKNEGVAMDIRDYTDDLHCEGWADFGDHSLKHSDEEAFLLFQKCVGKRGFYLNLEDGEFNHCVNAKRLHEKGICNDYINLLSDLPVEAIKEQIVEFLSRPSYESCKYCNGITDSSERFLPAEQLPSKERAS